MSHWFEGLDPSLSQVDIQTDALKAGINGLGESMLWVALGLLTILTVIGIIINFKFHDKLRSFFKIALSVLVGFAISLVGSMLILQIGRLSLKNEINLYFWLWVGFALVCIVSLTLCALIKVFKNKLFKLCAIISAVVISAYIVVIL